MKNFKFKMVTVGLIITMVSTLAIGCGKDSAKEESKTGTTEISGTITSLGSTALQPLVEQSASNFTSKYANAKINVQGGGSGAGINQVASGSVDIGNSDVEASDKLEDKNLAKDLVDHKVCAIGFAMVTSNDVKIDSLTKEQIQKIFAGEITNWKEVGGDDKKINIINRGKSSGTRATFVKTVMEGKSEKESLGTIQDSSGSVRTAIKQTEGAISYLALSYITEDVKKDLKVLKLEGIEANKENIVSNKYTFWSYEHMYTKGAPKGVSKAFLEYMVSDENKSLVEKLGYIPVSDMNK
ncbi:phosphate ABC transporter substrate-binding protein [Haloimpatiens sp. FM7315]|uniref:phosphate ABC transporter substrate-binding protein n=1 Tax=Haloimpatiens sp. FM7315 TaxID=3298609 RepID=UPI0035A315C9